MSGSPSDWAALARGEGFDPAEVRRVLGRYQAYCRYYAEGGRGEPLALEAWFHWYRLETASEVAQNGPTASGCSVAPGAEGRGAISRPEAFLKVLAALAAVEAAA
jgi:hypothetical protein